MQFDLIRLADTLLDFTVKKEEREAGGGEEGGAVCIFYADCPPLSCTLCILCIRIAFTDSALLYTD